MRIPLSNLCKNLTHCLGCISISTDKAIDNTVETRVVFGFPEACTLAVQCVWGPHGFTNHRCGEFIHLISPSFPTNERQTPGTEGPVSLFRSSLTDNLDSEHPVASAGPEPHWGCGPTYSAPAWLPHFLMDEASPASTPRWLF